MANSLEELVFQGDPGTLESEDHASKLQLMSPQQLYELWERQHWLSQEIDFSQDKLDWADLDSFTQKQLEWGLAAFFIGEERVTTQFSGLVMAYADEKEEAFLTTQQVDEARHMQFFDRFYSEVVGIDNPEMTDRLSRVRSYLNDDFVTLFDEILVEAGQKLIDDPSDVGAKVEFVTIYHLVIEGTLALTGQQSITAFLERENLLPGFVEGFNNVSRDEHRHVAYGAWFLKESAGKDPELAERMRTTLNRTLPIAAGVLVPQPFKAGDEWELLGQTSHEVNDFAFQSLSRRLKAIGVPLIPAESV